MKIHFLKRVIFVIILLSPFVFSVNTYAKTPCGSQGLECNDNENCTLDQPSGIFRCIPIPTGSLKIGNYQVDNPVPEFNTPADIINKLLPYLFTFSGITLLIILIASGFSYLTSGGDEKKVEQAKGKMTAALVGFILIVAAYWLTQIVEYLFSIKIF